MCVVRWNDMPTHTQRNLIAWCSNHAIPSGLLYTTHSLNHYPSSSPPTARLSSSSEISSIACLYTPHTLLNCPLWSCTRCRHQRNVCPTWSFISQVIFNSSHSRANTPRKATQFSLFFFQSQVNKEIYSNNYPGDIAPQNHENCPLKPFKEVYVTKYFLPLSSGQLCPTKSWITVPYGLWKS